VLNIGGLVLLNNIEKVKIIKEKINIKIALIVFSILQIFVILWMLISANLPLYFGEEIKIKTTPIDPRSLFRGNFVRLNYDLSPVSTDIKFKKGEKVYLSLKQANDFWITNKAYKNKPDGKYISCRVKNYYKNNVYFKCANINAFFTKKARALKLEKDLQAGGATAVIMLFNGKMTLKNIIPNNNN
jgi:hypothetical protein